MIRLINHRCSIRVHLITCAKITLLRKVLLHILFFTLLLSACRPDVKTAHWNVEALTPLVSTRIDFTDLITDDSTLVTSDSGLVSLVFRNQLVNLKPGEIAPPFNNEFFNTVKINSIDLGTRVINEKITLGRIAQQAGVTGQIIIASNGTSQPIPPINGLGPSTFNVDATSLFQTLTLKDGFLILRLENDLPADVTNVQYEISNQGGGVPLMQKTIASLPAGAVEIDSVRLLNNVVITGQLQASLVNVDFPGTGSNSVPIDTSDALKIRLTVDKLDPVSATAIFPAQNLFADTGTANIMASSALLTSVHLVDGIIFIDAESTVDDVISLEYLIPGATQNGQTLGFIERIAAAPPGGLIQQYTEKPVSDYNVDLTGIPGSINVFNEFYTIFNARIDSTGRLINLSLEDSVFIKTGIKGLVADRGYGFMGYDTATEVSRSAFGGIPELRSGSIELDNVILDIEIENYLGAPISFKINNVNSQNYGANPFLNTLTWMQLGQELSVPRGTEVIVGEKPQPGRVTYRLDKNNSNAQRLLETLPDSILIDAETYLNAGIPSSDLSQFLYTDYGVEAFLNVQIPLNLSMQKLQAVDTADFDYLDLDAQERLQGGAFNVLADNFYPFEFDLNLLLLDEQFNPIDTLESADIIASAGLDVDRRASTITKSKVQFPITSTKIENLKATKHLVFLVEFNTPNPPEKVKLYSDNYLDLVLVGDLSLSTK